MRESLFARLEPLAGVRVLDLYAGSGALGIEALSRGAERAVFVERATGALAALRANLTRLELRDCTRVLAADARAALRRLSLESARFELVLIDPPYRDLASSGVLEALVQSGVAAPGADVVVESARREPPQVPPGLSQRDGRRYGETLVTWLSPVEPGAEDPGADDAAAGSGEDVER